MVDVVNSEQYAKAAGAALDTYLTASTPFREVLEKAMTKALEQLSMPSRSDLLGLSERLTHIEMRLDDMDAKLDRLIKQQTPAAVSAAAPTGGRAPARKKRPAAKAKK
jgi:hypothetical protein